MLEKRTEQRNKNIFNTIKNERSVMEIQRHAVYIYYTFFVINLNGLEWTLL